MSILVPNTTCKVRGRVSPGGQTLFNEALKHLTAHFVAAGLLETEFQTVLQTIKQRWAVS